MRCRGGEDTLLPFLSKQRREQAERKGAPGARRETICSYALLRLALWERYGLAGAPEFTFGAHGKPFLKEEPSVFFSLSHSGDAVLCAVSDVPVGADLQEIRHVRLSAAKKFCAPEELEKISASSDLDRALCRLWCVKESCAKYTGRGFSEGFERIFAEQLLREKRAAVLERDGFWIGLCAGEKTQMPPLRVTEENELAEALRALSGGR